MNLQLEEADIARLAVRIAAELPYRSIPQHYSLQTVAERLECSVDHVRALVIAGKLNAVDIASGAERKTLRISHASLESWLADCGKGGRQ